MNGFSWPFTSLYTISKKPRDLLTDRERLRRQCRESEVARAIGNDNDNNNYNIVPIAIIAPARGVLTPHGEN